MSRKRCNRKVRVPMNPISLAMAGAAITPECELDKLRVRELHSMECIATGVGTDDDLQNVCAMLNLCEQLASMGVGPEALDACNRLEAELADTVRRMRETGKIGMSGFGLQAMRDVYAFHDLQRQSVARSVYEAAIFKTVAKVKNRAPGVVKV